MKKFISALSSFVIATTAMGGSMVFSTDAATNVAVSETIVSMRSNGKNEIKAKAGDTIPVEVFVPQSSGFNTLLLKFGVGKDGNLDDTKGQGYVIDRKGNKIENYKDAFGNYGITMVPKGDAIDGTATDFTYPNCFESGKTSDWFLDAGDISNTGIAMFNAEAWSILYQAEPEIKKGTNVDAFGAWVAAGGKIEEEFDYSNYTPVTTWTKDESWAYDYSFVKFDLVLPADLADGTYVFDIYRDTYINTHPASLFDDSNKPIADDQRGDAKSNFNGVNGDQKYSTEKLVIQVGEPTVTTTTPVATTTTPVATTTTPVATTTTPVATTTTAPATTTVAPVTTTVAPVTTTLPPITTVLWKTTTVTTATTIAAPTTTLTQPPANAIVYNLIPKDKEYTPAQENGLANNIYKAKPGEDLQIDWTIKNDQGTAGIQMNFDFTQVEYISGKRGTGYRIAPTYSDSTNTENLKKGEVIYTWAQSSEAGKAKDGAVIWSFNIKVPSEDGTYTLGLLPNTKTSISKVIPKDQDHPHTFVLYGLDIVVGDGITGTTTTAASSATTDGITGTTTTAASSATTDGITGTTTTAASSETTDGITATTTAIDGTTTSAPATSTTVSTIQTTLTTVSSAPSTTTAATVTTDPSAIVYNLIPRGKTYESGEKLGRPVNVYRGVAGETLTVDWTVKNDLGTAGIQMNFDFTQVEYIGSARGAGYRVNPTFSDCTTNTNLQKGEVVYTWAQSSEVGKAKDGAVIYSFNVKVPEVDGVYSLNLSNKAGDVNKVVPRKQDNPHKFVFYGLEIVVGSDVVTTTAIDGTTVPGSTTTTDGTTAGSQDTTTTITSTTSTNTETSVTGDGKTLYGDVNCDGVVRIGDVVLLNRYLAKNAQVTPQGLLNADCEKDNKIDGKDSVKIKKYLALIIKDTELGKASV